VLAASLVFFTGILYGENARKSISARGSGTGKNKPSDPVGEFGSDIETWGSPASKKAHLA
jgi:hypothetical protein